MTADAGITLAAPGGEPIPVAGLRVDRRLSHPVGRAEVLLPPGVAVPEAGETLSVTASSAGSGTAIMTGDVAERRAGPDGARLVLLDPAARLNRRAPSRAISGDTAGGVIGALCREVGIATGAMLPGITIPHMVLGHWESLLDHAIRLARLSGAALVSAVDGTLSMLGLGVPVPKGPVDPGRAALRAEDTTRAADPASLRFAGAGGMGFAGPGLSTLPLADDAAVAAGPADAGVRRSAAGIRILSDATLARIAGEARLKSPLSGMRIVTPLPEDLSPGDVVLLPDASGVPTRLARVETAGLSFGARQGLRATYAFSDVGLV